MILKLLSKKYEPKSKNDTSKSNDNDDSNSKFDTVIPTTDSALRNVYIVGTSSIWNNLPRPKVCMIDDNSYISIRQYTIQFFASGKMSQNASKDGVKILHHYQILMIERKCMQER